MTLELASEASSLVAAHDKKPLGKTRAAGGPRAGKAQAGHGRGTGKTRAASRQGTGQVRAAAGQGMGNARATAGQDTVPFRCLCRHFVFLVLLLTCLSHVKSDS